MRVTVEFYGVLRQVMGSDTLVVDADVETVGQVLDQLCLQQPQLAGQLPRVACAIGSDLVRREAHMTDGSTLALIPPVSGGSR
jgi:sulfur-carrier protein